ncbi:MAG TPA: hypothetical protein VF407_24490, partial [Polyangiaceae bacterium]
ELAKMKSTINLLQTIYGVLFALSLVILIGRWTIGLPGVAMIVWAIALGGAVAVRLYRTSLVNKYNTAMGVGVLR